MKSRIKILGLFFIIFISCNKNNGEHTFLMPVQKVMFVVDKTSDAYKLFVDKEGKLKENVYIKVGDYKTRINQIIEKKSDRKKELFEMYFGFLSQIEGENHSYIGLSTEGIASGEGSPSWNILKHVLHKVGEPFTIIIDDKEEFKITVLEKPVSKERGKKVMVNNVIVNGNKTKFLYSNYPIIYLN